MRGKIVHRGPPRVLRSSYSRVLYLCNISGVYSKSVDNLSVSHVFLPFENWKINENFNVKYSVNNFLLENSTKIKLPKKLTK